MPDPPFVGAQVVGDQRTALPLRAHGLGRCGSGRAWGDRIGIALGIARLLRVKISHVQNDAVAVTEAADGPPRNQTFVVPDDVMDEDVVVARRIVKRPVVQGGDAGTSVAAVPGVLVDFAVLHRQVIGLQARDASPGALSDRAVTNNDVMRLGIGGASAPLHRDPVGIEVRVGGGRFAVLEGIQQGDGVIAADHRQALQDLIGRRDTDAVPARRSNDRMPARQRLPRDPRARLPGHGQRHDRAAVFAVRVRPRRRSARCRRAGRTSRPFSACGMRTRRSFQRERHPPIPRRTTSGRPGPGRPGPRARIGRPGSE